MAKTLQFKRSETKFVPFGHKGPGTAEIARLVVLEGRYKMKAGGAMFEGGPGDVFFIPANTPLVHMGDKAQAPRHGMRSLVPRTRGPCRGGSQTRPYARLG